MLFGQEEKLYTVKVTFIAKQSMEGLPSCRIQRPAYVYILKTIMKFKMRSENLERVQPASIRYTAS